MIESKEVFEMFEKPFIGVCDKYVMSEDIAVCVRIRPELGPHVNNQIIGIIETGVPLQTVARVRVGDCTSTGIHVMVRFMAHLLVTLRTDTKYQFVYGTVDVPMSYASETFVVFEGPSHFDIPSTNNYESRVESILDFDELVSNSIQRAVCSQLSSLKKCYNFLLETSKCSLIQKFVTKTNEVTDLRNDFNQEINRQKKALCDSEERVECLNKKTVELQVLIDELKSIRSEDEAKLQQTSASIEKVKSERRDIDTENKLLRNELEDMKAQCDSLQAKTQLMTTEIMDFDEIKLENKVQIKTLNEELAEKDKLISAKDEEIKIQDQYIKETLAKFMKKMK